MTISLLDKASSVSINDYHPIHIIRAVNALQSLGKEKTLAQIDTYLENRDKTKNIDGLFWVLRVLFDIPPERHFPVVRIGLPNIPPPDDIRKLPRFPILIIRDIPFLVVSGYDLGGLAEPVETHIAYFRAHGILRNQPLTPPDSTNGIEKEFLQKWQAAYGDAYVTTALETIKAQISRISRQKLK